MNPAPTSRPSTSQHTPGVNYHATSERRRYEDLPPAVREAADLALGSPVVRADAPVTSGFTSAYAGRVLLSDGRHAFLKAAGPDFPWPVGALGREAQVLATLGDRIPAVPMIGAGPSDDGGHVLALQWVEGHLPGFPWTRDDIGHVREACEQIAQVPASGLGGLAPGRLVDDLLGDQALKGALTAALTAGFPLPQPSNPDLMPAWLPARFDDVLALAADVESLRVGDHVNHFDLRPDNLLIGRGPADGRTRAYVLDWNWFTLGPAWCDWVGVVPTMQAQGHDLGGLLDSSPLSRSADPHALDVWLALIAVYLLVNAGDEPMPGTTMALRQHQRYYARIFLNSLATHRGWR